MDRSLYVFIALACLAGCEAEIERVPVTEVLVRINASADVQAMTEKLRLRVAVQRGKEGEWLERPAVSVDMREDRRGAKSRWPVDVPVVPQDAENLPRLFEVVAEGVAEGGDVLVQRRAITSFVRRAQLVLELVLERCGERPIGQLCEQDAGCHGTDCQTCGGKQCEPTAITESDKLPRTSSAKLAVSTAGKGVEPTESPTDGDAGRAGAGAGKGGGTGGAGKSGASGGGAGGVTGTGGDGGSKAKPKPLAPLAWNEPVELESRSEEVVFAGSGRNRKGDAAVAWWQTTPDGYLWLQRFVNGKWDAEPLRIQDDANPSPYLPNIAVGVEDDGTTQMLWPSTSSCRWIRWAGSPSTATGSSAVAEGQNQCEALGLGVDAFGYSRALWSAIAERTTTSLQLYTNTFRPDTGWGTPTPFKKVTFDDQKYPWNGLSFTSYGTGWFGSVLILPGVVGAVPLSQADVRQLRIFVGDYSGVVETLVSFPDPMMQGSIGVDNTGNLSLFAGTGPDPSRTDVFGYTYQQSQKSWSPGELLSNGPTEAVGGAIEPNGDPFAIWLERPAGASTGPGKIMLSSHTAAGWTDAEPLLNDVELTKDIYLASDANTAGKRLISWAQKTTLADGTPGSAIYHMQYIRDRGWSEPGLVIESANDLKVWSVDLLENGSCMLVVLATEPGASTPSLSAITSK